MFPPKGSLLERILNDKDLLEQLRPHNPLETIKRLKIPDFLTKFPDFLSAPIVFNGRYPLELLQSAAQNAAKRFSEGLNSLVSVLVPKPVEDEYRSAVKRLLPAGSVLITPEYPKGSSDVLAIDINNDGEDELVVTFRDQDDSLKTVIIEKYGTDWVPAAQIDSGLSKGLHYRAVADLNGDGTKQLLLGVISDYGKRSLNGYSCAYGCAEKLFEADYEKFELVRNAGRNRSKGYQIALWHSEEPDSWKIDLYRWDGAALVQEDIRDYYDRRVLPGCIMEVRHNPKSVPAWYRLADSLARAGYYEDAKDIIKYALGKSRSQDMQERFLALQQKWGL